VVIVHGLKDHGGRYGKLATRLVERGIARVRRRCGSTRSA
jgi:alpha-beta hydrolase superfamily lysophospholipase